MKPAFYISRTGERFPWEGYSNIEEARGNKLPLPLDGYPYAVEALQEDPTPVFSMGDEPWDHIQNIMCWVHYENSEAIAGLKNLCKDIRTHPAPLLEATINFVTNDMAAHGNANGLKIFEHPLSPEKIVDIVMLMMVRKECGIGADVVSAVTARLIEDSNLSYADALQCSLPLVVDDSELDAIVSSVLSEFPDKVAEYRGGKKGIEGFFIGAIKRKVKNLDMKMLGDKVKDKLKGI